MIPNPVRALFASIRLLLAKILGFRTIATPDEQTQRLNICEACEELVMDTRQCAICTCYVDFKTLLAPEGCPKKKWLPIWERRSTVNR